MKKITGSMSIENIDMGFVLKTVGLNKARRNRDPVKTEKIRKQLIRIGTANQYLLSFRVLYDFFDYKVLDENRVIIYGDKEEIFTGSYLARNLSSASPDQVAIFIATIGSDFLEKYKSQSIFRNRDRLYMEALASGAVEYIAEYICNYLAKIGGFQKTFKRLSPGWGEQKGLDWKITDQKVLFRLMGEKIVEREIDVKLSDGCMMFPRKSVSAIAFPT